MMTSAAALLFVASTVGGLERATAQAQPLALVGGRLIDGSGAPPVANSVILVHGERIGTVCCASRGLSSDTVDGTGRRVRLALTDPNGRR
jgi:hypothetical protein